MFWVINKDKVFSYLVTLSAMGVLILLGTMLPKETIETSKREVISNVNIENNVLDNNNINNIINEII